MERNPKDLCHYPPTAPVTVLWGNQSSLLLPFTLPLNLGLGITEREAETLIMVSVFVLVQVVLQMPQTGQPEHRHLLPTIWRLDAQGQGDGR